MAGGKQPADRAISVVAQQPRELYWFGMARAIILRELRAQQKGANARDARADMRDARADAREKLLEKREEKKITLWGLFQKGDNALTSAALMDLSRFYEARHVIDEHGDMGLDIDSMTYEELVALEEQIGYVSTGLTESYIQENLRSSFYVPGAACISDQSPVENDACIICQEEYEAKELVGALDCGHKYHTMCIKQWLMVKNLCPICKTTALSANRRNGCQ